MNYAAGFRRDHFIHSYIKDMLPPHHEESHLFCTELYFSVDDKTRNKIPR